MLRHLPAAADHHQQGSRRKQHKWALAGRADAPTVWPHTLGGEPITVSPQARVRVNDCEHAREAVLQGLGMGHAARWLFDEDLRTGHLV